MSDNKDETEQLYRRYLEWVDGQCGEEDRLSVTEAIINGSAWVTVNEAGKLKYVPLAEVYKKPS